MQKFLFYNKFTSCLYMFRAHVLINRRSKLHYTASAPVHETATYSCDDTRGCVMQFWPPDDEHMCSKHVEAWNNLIVKQKFWASSWLITEINTLRCTVSKTSKRCHPVCLGQCCVRAESVHAPWGEVVLGRCWSCGVVFCCLWWGLSVTPVCCCVCVDILSCLRFSWQL